MGEDSKGAMANAARLRGARAGAAPAGRRVDRTCRGRSTLSAVLLCVFRMNYNNSLFDLEPLKNRNSMAPPGGFLTGLPYLVPASTYNNLMSGSRVPRLQLYAAAGLTAISRLETQE